MVDIKQRILRNRQDQAGLTTPGGLPDGGGGASDALPEFIGLNQFAYIGNGAEFRPLLSTPISDPVFMALNDYKFGGPSTFDINLKMLSMIDNGFFNSAFALGRGIDLDGLAYSMAVPPLVGADDGNLAGTNYDLMGIGRTKARTERLVFISGTYTGDAAASRLISTGLPPGSSISALYVKGVGLSGVGAWKYATQAGNGYSNTQGSAEGRSIVIEDQNFRVAVPPTLGANTVNDAGDTYWFFAFATLDTASDDSLAINEIDTGFYIGDGTGFRTIPTNLTVVPRLIVVAGRTTSMYGFKTAAVSSDTYAEEDDTSVFSSGIAISGTDFEVSDGGAKSPNTIGERYDYFVMG